MEEKHPAIYIMASRKNGTLYVGVTSNIRKRVWEHKQGLGGGFTQKYGCKKLVYFEIYDDMAGAITREKQLKAGSRKKKLALIEAKNPEWRDVYEPLF